MKFRAFISAQAVWLLLSLLSILSMEFYVAQIWSAGQPARFNDVYAPWWAAHELLLHGRNPYSPEIAHEIQTVIYGAPVTPSAHDPSGIAGGFAYPPYTALLLWPTLHLSFPAAQKILFGFSLAVTLISVVLWLRALRLRQSKMQVLTLMLFVLGSFPVLQGIRLLNLSLIAAACIALTFYLLAEDHLVLAGIFLAVSTFKPQFTIVLIPWLALWTFSNWRRRSSLLWSFLVTLLLLVLIGEWLVPGWVSSFLHLIRAYRHYTYGNSLLDVWFTRTWGPWIAAAVLIAALAQCWPSRSQPADSPCFLPAVSLLLATTLVVIPTLAPHAQLLLLPGILCLLRHRILLISSGPLARSLLAGVWVLLGWPWVATFALLLATLHVSLVGLRGFWEIPLYTSPVFPLAALLALTLLVRVLGGFQVEPEGFRHRLQSAASSTDRAS